LFDVSRDILQGRGRSGDLDLLVEIGKALRLGSLCGHGQAAAGPLMSALRYFRDEYQAHIEEKRCPAGVCNLRSSPPERSEAACDVLGAHA
jgi:NADH:ubiquinone oxidoreductase subunit F (NADH-binding)